MSFQHTTHGATPLDQNNMVAKMLAMARKYGGVSGFITIAPDSINNPTVFQMTLKRLDLKNMPSQHDVLFMDAIQNGSTFVTSNNIPISCSYDSRAKAIIDNPLPSVLEYINIIYNLFCTLLGIKPECSFMSTQCIRPNKTVYFKKLEKGLFGHCLGACMVTETQHRHDLHSHMLIFGGLPPKLLQDSACFPEICNVISTAIDSMFSHTIPRPLHVHSRITEKAKLLLSESRMDGSLAHVQPLPPFNKTNMQFKNPCSPLENNLHAYAACLTAYLGIHRHSFTCKKAPVGLYRCRLAFNRKLSPSTHPVQLQRPPSGDDSDIKFVESTTISHKPKGLGLNPPGNDVIFWNVKRPSLCGLPPLPNEEPENVRNFILHQLNKALELPDEYNGSLFLPLREQIYSIFATSTGLFTCTKRTSLPQLPGC